MNILCKIQNFVYIMILKIKLKNKIILEITDKLKNNLSTTPTNLKDELECNIFLRCKNLDSFSKLRDLKDNF